LPASNEKNGGFESTGSLLRYAAGIAVFVLMLEDMLGSESILPRMSPFMFPTEIGISSNLLENLPTPFAIASGILDLGKNLLSSLSLATVDLVPKLSLHFSELFG